MLFPILRWIAHRLPVKGRERFVRMFAAPGQIADHDFEVPFHGHRYPGNLNHFIDWYVYFMGAYSGDEVTLLGDVARVHRLNESGPVVAWDIGGNVGHHALFLASCCDRVVCFEPLAAHVASIDHKIKLNQLNNIDVHAVALGDRSGVMSLHHPDFEATDNPGTASLLAGYNLNNNILESEVEVVVGDEFALVHDLPGPQILKIDVEGFEIPVLLGLNDVIAHHQPVILMETALSPGNRSMRWRLSMLCYRTRSSSM